MLPHLDLLLALARSLGPRRQCLARAGCADGFQQLLDPKERARLLSRVVGSTRKICLSHSFDPNEGAASLSSFDPKKDLSHLFDPKLRAEPRLPWLFAVISRLTSGDAPPCTPPSHGHTSLHIQQVCSHAPSHLNSVLVPPHLTSVLTSPLPCASALVPFLPLSPSLPASFPPFHPPSLPESIHPSIHLSFTVPLSPMQSLLPRSAKSPSPICKLEVTCPYTIACKCNLKVTWTLTLSMLPPADIDLPICAIQCTLCQYRTAAELPHHVPGPPY